MPNFGVNYWPSYSGPAMWRDFRPGEIERDLAALRAQGVDHVRAILFWPDFMPTPERVEQEMLDRLDHFLRLAEQARLDVQLTLIVGHMSGQNWSPAWLDDPQRLFSDPDLLRVQELYLSEVVRRARGHACLHAYILTNEMPHFTGPAPQREVRAWAERLYALVKTLDPARPVGLGDGGWTADANGFTPDLPQDYLGPHIYAQDTDPERLVAHYGLAVSVARALGGGRPVWLEEFGAPHSVYGEAQVAEWAGQVAREARLQGAERFCWWCGLDFELPDQEPYSHHAFEMTFGLLRADRTPRAAAAALRAASQDPVPDLPEVGLLVPSYLYTPYPFTAHDPQLVRRALHNAYAALRRLGYRPRAVLERQLSGEAALPHWLVVPSTQKLLARTWAALERFPGRVLYSYFHGSHGFHGAWTSRAESFFGGQPCNRFGLPARAPTQLRAGPHTWALPTHPDPFVTTPLLLEPVSAQVLGRDEQGRPLWVREEQRDLLLFPLEALAPTPEVVASVYEGVLGPAPAAAPHTAAQPARGGTAPGGVETVQPY